MIKDKQHKKYVRAYAKKNNLSYTAALREVMAMEPGNRPIMSDDDERLDYNT